MKHIRSTQSLLLLFLLFGSCKTQTPEVSFPASVVYQSDSLIITQISPDAYIHTSFLTTQDFGKVPCNGLIISNNNESIIFDTPTDDNTSDALLQWIKNALHSQVKAVIPTHFHNDCLGGLKRFHEYNIPSYAYAPTIAFAQTNNMTVPGNSFKDSLVLKAGTTAITVRFFGGGHTRDNVVAYIPAEHILFGGCLIKELGAGVGYLGDAQVATWSATVTKVKQAYPDVRLVIPGHGAYGDAQLLDYTIQLFKDKE